MNTITKFNEKMKISFVNLASMFWGQKLVKTFPLTQNCIAFVVSWIELVQHLIICRYILWEYFFTSWDGVKYTISKYNFTCIAWSFADRSCSVKLKVFGIILPEIFNFLLIPWRLFFPFSNYQWWKWTTNELQTMQKVCKTILKNKIVDINFRLPRNRKI